MTQERTTLLHFLRRLIVMLAAAVVLHGCSAASAKAPSDTLLVVESSEANTIDPLYANNAPAFFYYRMVFDGLAADGPGFTFLPSLGTQWRSTPDHLHWTVDLRHGVKWSDGAPFDARDVVFTWKTMLDPKVGDPYAGQYDFMQRVVAENAFRVRFDLKRPYAAFENLVLDASSAPILPEHILGKLPPAAIRTSSFSEHPIGTGPYVVKNWQHDDNIVFERNPNYWRTPAKIARIQVRIVFNQDAMGEALENGTADIADNLGAREIRLLGNKSTDLKIMKSPDLYTYFVYVRLNVPGLSDLAVRHAMEYGWNRPAVADGLLHGSVIVTNSIVPKAIAYYHTTAGVPQYAYDPAKARAILDAAGWRTGSDGIRRKGNVKLAFPLLIGEGGPGSADTMVEFQADMRAIGVACDIQTLDYPTFIERTNSGNFQLAWQGWGGTPDPDQFTFLDSSQILPVGNNMMGYSNKTVDRDLRLGRTTSDRATRKRYYDEMQRITGETLPVLWGYDTTFQAVYRPRLDIHGSHEPDLNFWWNLNDWTLAE